MRKKIIHCLLIIICGSFILGSSLIAGAFDENLLDNPDYEYKDDFGFLYQEKVISENGLNQKIFYGECNTTNSKYEWVIHSVRDGSTTTLATVMDIAKNYEIETGNKVIYASNGDYFYATGGNVDSYVNDGIVVSKGSFITKHCIGFDNLGNLAIGRMTDVEKRLMVVINGQKQLFTINKFDEEPSENEIAIYTKAGTYQINNAGKYIINTDNSNISQYPVWGESHRTITGTSINNDSFTIKSGQFAIVLKGENCEFFFENVLYGVEVDLVEIPSGAFLDLNYVIGGYDILVNNYIVNNECHTDNSGNANAPRTFIGFKEDGTGFLCMIDGRQAGYSSGITVNQEAELAGILDAKYALELDGGGSTTVIVRIDDELVLRNKPSDGSQRKVSNAVMLIEKKEEDKKDEEEDPIIDDDKEKEDETDKVVENDGCKSLSIVKYIVTINGLCLVSYLFRKRK